MAIIRHQENTNIIDTLKVWKQWLTGFRQASLKGTSKSEQPEICRKLLIALILSAVQKAELERNKVTSLVLCKPKII